MFDTIAAWVVLVLFASGLWLTGHALWAMAADSQARREARAACCHRLKARQLALRDPDNC